MTQEERKKILNDIEITTILLSNIFEKFNPGDFNTIFKKSEIKPFKTERNFFSQYKHHCYYLDDINEKFFINFKNRYIKRNLEFIFNNNEEIKEYIIEYVYNWNIQEKIRKEEAKIQRKKEKEERIEYAKQFKINLELKAEEYKELLIDKWFSNTNTKYILHVGPTCSGKTYNALLNLNNDIKGVYLAPLRLLAWEVYDKLNSKGINCSLITGEERQINDNAKIISSTIEMLNYNEYYDEAIIDECFMINDKDRGKNWLKAILEIKAKNVHLILNDECLNLVCSILSNTNKTFEIKKYNRLTELEIKENHHKLKEEKHDKTIFITFSRTNVLMYKAIFEERGYDVSVLYGNLPPEIKRQQMDKFINNENQICVSTDVLGMGLNLPCKTIWFLDLRKYDGVEERYLTPIEIKQIAGRAGRYGYNEKGYVCTNTKQDTDKIKHAFKEKTNINFAYFGIDFEMFKNIPVKSYYDKLDFFEKVNCIPEIYGHTIIKQDITSLKNIARNPIISNIESEELAWALINCPIKNNNKEYFYNAVELMCLNEPQYEIDDIENSSDLENIEQYVSEIDMYLFMSNNDIIKKYFTDIGDREDILKTKQTLISLIDKYLVNKKLSGYKACSECGEKLELSWPHKMCNDCYESRPVYYNRW